MKTIYKLLFLTLLLSFSLVVESRLYQLKQNDGGDGDDDNSTTTTTTTATTTAATSAATNAASLLPSGFAGDGCRKTEKERCYNGVFNGQDLTVPVVCLNEVCCIENKNRCGQTTESIMTKRKKVMDKCKSLCCSGKYSRNSEYNKKTRKTLYYYECEAL